MARRKRKKIVRAGRPMRRTKEQRRLEQVLRQAESWINAGRLDEATRVLEENLNRFGRFPVFRGLLADVYLRTHRYQEAAEQIRLALDLSPQDFAAQLLAAEIYELAGYHTFAHRARERCLQLNPQDPSVEPLRRMEEAYWQVTQELKDRYRLSDVKAVEEAGYRMDQGRWALERGRWEDALRYSRMASELAPQWPPPRNNFSIALYYLGRYDEAIAAAKAVLQECDPDNVHALSNLIHFCLIAGKREEANRYADRLARLPLAEAADEIVKQVEGLAFLDREDDIERILNAAQKKLGELPPPLLVQRAIIAANQGQHKKALKILQQAREKGYTSPLLNSTEKALKAGKPGPGLADRYPHTHYSSLIASKALEEVGALMQREIEREERDERAWARLLERYPQLPMVVRRMLYEGPDTGLAMLELLAAMGTSEAVATLREFATGTKGELDDRLYALRLLQMLGEVGPGEEIEMWVEGQRQPIRPVLQTISDEFVPDYTPQVWELLEKAVAAQHEGKLEEAERLYKTILELEPQAKEAYHNLAVIYQQQGMWERVDECLDKALAIDPLYPFPRTARARQALRQGDVEAAKKWLDPLGTKEKWHPLGFVAYQKTMARIAMAEKRFEAARQHLSLAQDFREDDEELQQLLAHLDILETSDQWASTWREYADRYRRRRQKAKLPADPDLADCLGLLTKGDMLGILRVLGLRGYSGKRKAQIRNGLEEVLSDPLHLNDIVAELTEAERAALGDLLDHGGVMDWQAFADRHGDDLAESPYLEYHADELQSVMGRLRARALLFEGTAEGQLIVAIPRELRPLLREALRQTGNHPAGGD